MTKKYEYTYWNHTEWFRSDCWCNAEKTAERFPQCVAKGEELGKKLIEQKTKQDEWNKAHPGQFKNFETIEIPSHRGKWGTKQQEDCVEHFLAYSIFYAWYQTTESWKKAMDGTQRQISAYFTALAEDPVRLTDTKDSTTDAYEQYVLHRKVEEAQRLLRR